MLRKSGVLKNIKTTKYIERLIWLFIVLCIL